MLLKRIVLLAIATTFCAGCEDTRVNSPQADAGATETEPVEAAPVEMIREKAVVGSGKEGSRVRKHNDAQKMISGPAHALFQTRQRVIFEIQIPHALNLYKATNGNAPKTHEEFMEKIVKFNQLELPELPEGHTYVYDPETAILMVERPAKN